MPKNQYIILFLVLAVTVINLFYKPWMFSSSSTSSLWFNAPWIHPVTMCPLYGFKCPTDEPCDCSQLCSNGDSFLPFRVMDDEKLFLMDRQLTPGTYCVPKGIGQCDEKTSYQVFTVTGWKCVPRTPVKEPCKTVEAADNTKNRVWDFKESSVAKNVEHWYEMYGGRLRYGCKCESLDKRGVRLVSTLPFICSTDYCVRDIAKPKSFMGWNGKECVCGPYSHLDPTDKTSPCVSVRMRVENNKLMGRVNCTSDVSFKRSGVYCPPNEYALQFEVPVLGSDATSDYITMFQP